MQPIVENAKEQLSQARSFLDFANIFATLFKITLPGQDQIEKIPGAILFDK